MIGLLTHRRRLLRKRMYRSPHKRKRQNTYYRENRKLNKDFQKEYVNKERIHVKRRPKREVISGFKMSYRYKYYNQEEPEEEEDEEL
ncbi:MAG: hypothetical protein IK044_05130 [Methanobrevibacter sp.]|nr:hypothetical protein [Methanobrevibacter sp.]